MVRRISLSLLLVLAGFVAGLVLTGRMRIAGDSSADVAALPAQAPPAAASAPLPAVVAGPTSGPDFTRIAGQAVKGVANISSVQVLPRARSPFADDPFFEYFFGDQDPFGARDRRSLSLGSGVVVSSDGYLVTNSHVVGEDIRRIRDVTIALADKREIRGRVIGTDPTTDIALLKIDVAGLPAVQWGDSSTLQVGEWVLAIGSPFQLSQTVTAGIVSATGRSNIGFSDYEDFIQTDAAINPGNSGGALINSRGELIGINTGIFSQSGGYQGIGFAVPSNLARHVVDDLAKYGEVRRGSIGGVQLQSLTPELVEGLGLQSTNGLLVVRMAPRSEAYQAGVEPGDVIVAFNSQKVNDPSQFFRLVADARIGSTATLTVLRNGRSRDVKIPIVSNASR
jgi:Do/DeqQ family serine protease